MTGRGPEDYPVGSVGRYVRERWGDNAAARRAQAPPPRTPDPADEETGAPTGPEPAAGYVPPRPGYRPGAATDRWTRPDETPTPPAGLDAVRPAGPDPLDREPDDAGPAGRRGWTVGLRRRVGDDRSAGAVRTAPEPEANPAPAPRAAAPAESVLPVGPGGGEPAAARRGGSGGEAPGEPAGLDPGRAAAGGNGYGQPPSGRTGGPAEADVPPAAPAPTGPAGAGCAADAGGGAATGAGNAADGGGGGGGGGAATGAGKASDTGGAAPGPPRPARTRAAATGAGREAYPGPSDRGGSGDPTPDRARPDISGAVSPRPGRPAARWVEPGAVAAQEAQRARSDAELTPPDLSSARLLRPTKRPPQSGWRRVVYVLSGRLINPGESPADVRRRELTARVNKPLIGCHKIAMLSLKGGVGKTTVTATLGASFASLRGDRVVAVDANPDRGTLSQKIPLETTATVRHLLRDAQRVRRYTDVRAYTSQGPSRLEVLASEQDPAVSEAFSEDDYRRTVTLLEHFYNIVLTDCGTGLMHSAMYGVLGVADQLIIVSSGSIDGARSASATMDWLDAHGHGDLVRRSVAVINNVHRAAGGVDLDRVADHFSARCRAVVTIPFDPHLEEGAEIDLDRLEPATRIALLELAANVADDFPS